MSPLRAALVGVALVTSALGGCKGDPVQCEAAIRNYTSLVYWDKADKDIAAAPEADRAKLRADKLAGYERELAGGIDTLTSQCVSAGNDKEIQCMIDAKTAADARGCTN
jgi:hypothetical protein